MRFLPMFDFYQNRYIVVTLDADYDKSTANDHIKRINNDIKKMEKKDILFRFCTYRLHKFIISPRLVIPSLILKHNFIARSFADRLITRKKMPKSLILDFFDCMVNKCGSYNEWLKIYMDADCTNEQNEFDIKYICDATAEIKGETNAQFIYGIDEFFVNKYVLDYILSKNIRYIYNFLPPTVPEIHFILYNFAFKYGIVSSEYMFRFYDTILGKGSGSIKDNYHKLDKIIYEKKDSNAKLSCKKIHNFLTTAGVRIDTGASALEKTKYTLYFKMALAKV